MLVVVGRIGRAHGVRGEVAVEPRTDEVDQRFAVGGSLLTESGDRTLTIDSVRRHHGRLLVRFAELADRQSVEAVRGLLLQAEVAGDEVPDEPDTWYDRQLVGLSVEVDGRVIGHVKSVVHLPAQDLLEVELGGGSDALVPLVSAIVTEVDVAGGRVLLDPPPGLLEAGE
jgi:16S rRNA processing protein RimM